MSSDVIKDIIKNNKNNLNDLEFVYNPLTGKKIILENNNINNLIEGN